MIELKRIKDLREDNDLSQEALAKQLHISQRVYSHYETGTRKIPLEIVIDLADFYDCSIDYLVSRTNKKEVNK